MTRPQSWPHLWPQLLPPLWPIIFKKLQEEDVESFETQRKTKDGRILDVWLTVTKLVDVEGKPVAIATTERNITQRK